MPREVKSRWSRNRPPSPAFASDREDRLEAERSQRDEMRRETTAFLRSKAGTNWSSVGVIERVENYGVFVSCPWGSGLVHISRMAGRFIRKPTEIVEVGDFVRVWVIGVDEKDRVALTMVAPEMPGSGTS